MFVSRMELIDKTILQGFMKLWLYQHYVVAYLAWPFMVYDFDVSWVTSLRTIANRYLKRWAGLYSRAVVSILYRQRKKYGLQLTCLVSFYKRLQVGQTFLLKHSDDNNLKIIYGINLLVKPTAHLYASISTSKGY